MVVKIRKWTLSTGDDAQYGRRYLADWSGLTGGPLIFYCEPSEAKTWDALGKQVMGYEGVLRMPKYVYEKLLSLYAKGLI